jgi:hypothetical protein
VNELTSDHQASRHGGWSAVVTSRPIAIGILDILSLVVVSLLLTAVVVVSAGFAFAQSVFLAIAAISFVAFVAGRAVLALFGVELPAGIRFASAFSLGLFGLSAFITLTCLLLKSSVMVPFIAALAATAIVAGVSFRWLPGQARDRDAGSGFLALIAIAALSIIWSWQAIRAVPVLHATSTLTIWQDFFFHSAMVSQFAHFSDFGSSWIYAPGVGMPIYHYASYMLPAVVNALSGAPAISLVSALNQPLGFLAMGLATWVLGHTLAGRLGGAASIGAVLLLPSAAFYGFQNAYYNFFWLLQITTTAYAVGVTLLAIAFAIQSVRQHAVGTALIAAMLALGVAMFKAQSAPLLWLSSLLFVALYWRPRKRWMPWALLAFACALGMLGLAAMQMSPRAPDVLQPWDPRQTLQSLLMSPAYLAGLSGLFAVPVLLGVLLVSAFGALAPAYVVGALASRAKGVGERFDLVPFLVVLVFSIIALALPAATSSEFQHRPFPIVYAILAIWVASMSVRLVRAIFPRRAWIPVFTAGLLLIPFPFILQQTAQTGQADWMRPYANGPVPPGLSKCAEYIRIHSRITDVIVRSSNDGAVPIYGQLTALAERPTYVLMLQDHVAWKLWGISSDTVEAREAVVHQLRQAPTIEDLYRIAQDAGIGWFVLSPPDRMPDAVMANAVLTADGFALFRIPPRAGS